MTNGKDFPCFKLKVLSTILYAMIRTALIVEDDELMGRMLSLMLKKMGFTTVKALTAKEALSASGKHYKDPFCIAIIDLNLPDTNGADLLMSLHLANPNLPALLCTGMVDDTIATMSYSNFGFDGVLCKPFNERELRQSITKVLECHHSEKVLLA
ncbi:MAG: response regulator [Verrucomicrobiota bacterium]